MAKINKSVQLQNVRNETEAVNEREDYYTLPDAEIEQLSAVIVGDDKRAYEALRDRIIAKAGYPVFAVSQRVAQLLLLARSVPLADIRRKIYEQDIELGRVRL